MDGSIETKAAQFLRELTELGRKYRLGIAGDPVLFEMEWEDENLSYSIDKDSKLKLG